MKNIIMVRGVSKSFQGKQVLQNVTISFEAGKIHGIIGRNGSGKTVLIKTICGLIRPDAGSVTVDGKEIGKDVDFPQNIGVIIEAPGFLPYQSGYKNLYYLASLRNVIGKEDIRDAIKTVGLDPDDPKHVGKYSMGMKQRLGLAQAIMEKPEILILDEVLSVGDAKFRKKSEAKIRSMFDKGITVLFVSHSVDQVLNICNKAIILDKGRIIAQGSAEEICEKYGDMVRQK